jgi:hypothetical protein
LCGSFSLCSCDVFCSDLNWSGIRLIRPRIFLSSVGSLSQFFVPWVLQARKGIWFLLGCSPAAAKHPSWFSAPTDVLLALLGFSGPDSFPRPAPDLACRFLMPFLLDLSLLPDTGSRLSVFSRPSPSAPACKEYKLLLLEFSSDLYNSFWFLFFLIKHHVSWSSIQVNPYCCCLLGLCESRFLFGFCSF